MLTENKAVYKMYWARLLALFFLMATHVCCDQDHRVFVIAKLPITTCISNPVNDLCPVNHQVPDRIQNLPWIDRNVISQVLISRSLSLQLAGGDGNCTDAYKMFQCSTIIYTCKTNLSYVYLDSERAYTLCVSAKQACAGVSQALRDKIFNCSLYRNASVRYEKGESCEEYPKLENNTCPTRRYKVST